MSVLRLKDRGHQPQGLIFKELEYTLSNTLMTSPEIPPYVLWIPNMGVMMTRTKSNGQSHQLCSLMVLLCFSIAVTEYYDKKQRGEERSISAYSFQITVHH